MIDMRHIIVAMDEASLADPSVLAAWQLAPVLDTDVRITHVVEPWQHHWSGGEHVRAAALAARLSAARANRLTHLQNLQVANSIVDVDADEMLQVLSGRPAQVLAKCGGNYNDTLLMIGSHRDRGVFDFGGTTRELLGASTRRVWIQAGEFLSVRTILVPIDLSEGSASVLETAVYMARAFGAKIDVLYCFEPPSFAYGPEVETNYVVDDERAQLRSQFESLIARELPKDCDHTLRVIDGSPAEIILEQQETADLTVMGSHGRSMLSSVMLGSQAYRVLKHASRSVVIVPQTKSKMIAGQ